jgi:hypothetical protein
MRLRNDLNCRIELGEIRHAIASATSARVPSQTVGVVLSGEGCVGS